MSVKLCVVFFVICEFSSVIGYPAKVSSKEATLRILNNGDDQAAYVKTMKKFDANDTESVIRALSSNGNSALSHALKCSACKFAMDFALWKFRKPDGSYDGLSEFIDSLCKRLDIETNAVCDGMVNTYKRVVLTLLSKLQLSAEEVCGLVLPTTCYAPDLPWNKIDWNVTIPGNIPKKKNEARNLKPRASETSTLRVLQLSDIHIDRGYTVGSVVDCSEPLCCRNNKKIRESSRSAGRWGSLGYCDTPPWTLENLLQHLSQKEYDYIIWTGDLPAHNDWNQSKEDQVTALYNLTNLLLKYFPKTPIYPALGNHESYPVNNFPPRYVNGTNSISWLYSALRKAWSPWLPQEALDTVNESGFYTTLVKPNFRIISLNMNYCNQQNWWMLINPVDPNRELQWLVDVLTKAEEKGERVHILGHIPPGSYDCLPIWSHNYYRIINRFKDTISAQFFGHTHSDEMEIFYDEKTKKVATSMAYISPSVTTFFNLHPGYREYTVDGFFSGSKWDVLDHSTYILNLTKANNLPEGQNPTWDFLYSAKDAFSIPDLKPETWDALVRSWISGKDAKSEVSFQKYYYYYYKGNPPKPTCDAACKKGMLCDIRSARSGDSEEFCAGL